MRRTRINRTVLAAATVAGLTVAGFSPTAMAQMDALDKTQLIEGLRRESLGELLKHMVETEQMKDPILKKQVLINQLLLDYDTKISLAVGATDPAEVYRLRQEALVDFDRAADERRGLIRDYHDNEQRPLWQTDLAEMMLFEYLRVIKNNATEFYEVGVPTADQKEAFERVVPEMLEALSDADSRFFVLQRDLPQEKDHVRKRVDTGLWDRMMNQYYTLRTRFFLAHAAYYATLLPPNHPLWAKMGSNPNIVAQKKTYAEEVKRLLEIDCLEKLDKFSKDMADPFEIRWPSTALIARAQAALKRNDEALHTYDEVIKRGQPDIYDLISKIGKLRLLESMKRSAEALTVLNDLKGQGLVTSNLLMRLLAVDAEHKLLLGRAQGLTGDKEIEALTAAYEPYAKFLNDPALGSRQQLMREYVYKRWESSIPANADLNRVPAMVVGAIGEMAKNAGLELNNQANQADSDADKLKASQLRSKAREKFDRSIAVNTGLLVRAGLSNSVRAQAMYNLGIAQYWLDPLNLDNQIKSARAFLEIAKEMHDEPMAEESITYAVKMLRPLFLQKPRAAGVEALYEDTVHTLFDKFPNSGGANDERVFYAEEVLMPASRYIAAAGVLTPLPSSHPQYFFGQRDLLVSLQAAYRRAVLGKGDPIVKPVTQAAAVPVKGPAASTQPATTQTAASQPAGGAQPVSAQVAEVEPPPPDPKVLGENVIVEATRVINEADAAQGGADADMAPSIRGAGGQARLVLADMYVEFKGDIVSALSDLEGFEGRYQGEPDLIRMMLAKRIVLKYKTGKLEDAVTEANLMMKTSPDDAAIVIDQVLTEIIASINTLREQAAVDLVPDHARELLKSADALADSALKLAQLEVDWADDPNAKRPADLRLNVKIQFIRTLLMAQQYDRALKIVTPMYVQYPNNGDVIDCAARAQFAIAVALVGKDLKAGEAMLTDEKTGVAAKLGLIIRNVPKDANGKYPEIFWHAWRDRLVMIEVLYQAYSKAGKNAAENPYREAIKDIGTRVGQLRSFDPNFGGEIYKKDFERLERVWGGAH